MKIINLNASSMQMTYKVLNYALENAAMGI
jgi:hypothetical protein